VCLLGSRILPWVLRTHRNAAKAKPVEDRANRAGGQPHTELRFNHPSQIDPAPTHHAMLRLVRALAHPGSEGVGLFGRKPGLGATAASLVVQPRQTSFVITVHPITQRLPIHPAQACSLRPRVALEHQGQGQHTSCSIRISAAARLPTKRRCRVIPSREFDRHAHLRPP
jgi:hypothetical protein